MYDRLSLTPLSRDVARKVMLFASAPLTQLHHDSGELPVRYLRILCHFAYDLIPDQVSYLPVFAYTCF